MRHGPHDGHSHSHSHAHAVRPPGRDTIEFFNANGRYGDPVHCHTGGNTANGDFWPRFYSRTHVGRRTSPTPP